MSPPDDTAEQQRHAALADYQVTGLDDSDPVVPRLRELCELAAGAAGMPNAVISLVDDRAQHQVAVGIDPAPGRPDEAMWQLALAEGRDVHVPDASTDPRFAASPWVDGRRSRIRCYASTILRTPAGQVLGTLTAFGDRPRELAEDQLRALRLIARQVVDALELRRQLERADAELSEWQHRLASFAGQLSHDLKAPLTAILGFSELLGDMDSIAQDAAAAGYVRRCSSSARRMLAMIDELLAHARSTESE